MAGIQEVVDKFSGFITKEQAEYILNGTAPQPKPRAPSTPMRIDELSQYASSSGTEEITVNIKDNIYRIFNPTSAKINGRESVSRKLILGEEGNTAVMALNEKISGFIDMNAFERGDLLMASNALYSRSTGELRCGPSTSINRMSPSVLKVFNDFSELKGESRKIDLVGRLVEIGLIRHVTRLGGSGQIALASCIISDSRISIGASFWGSSALATSRMKPNEFIKMEFCDVRTRENSLHIYANDDSRVSASSAFSKRMK